MISIITAVHNCLSHNEIFLESLKKYTYFPYELIVIDNDSTDGSYELFKRNECKIIRNKKNLCYPESINLGSPYARGEYICLLNNDVFCGVFWDKHLIEAMNLYNLDIVSPSGIEGMPSRPLTHLFFKRWGKVGEKKHLGANADRLRRLLVSMYGEWEKFCQVVYEMYHPRITEGIAGNCVFMKRSALKKIGPLDEEIQSADWDLYLTVRKRAEEIGDMHRVMTVCWAYVHHFIRTTLKSHPEPLACTHPRKSIEEKWGRENLERFWAFPQDVISRPAFYKEPFKYWRYKRDKIKSRRIKTENENQWVQFWKELDKARLSRGGVDHVDSAAGG